EGAGRKSVRQIANAFRRGIFRQPVNRSTTPTLAVFGKPTSPRGHKEQSMLALSLFSLVSIAIGFLAVLLGALNFYFQHLHRRSALLVKCLHSNQAPGHTTTALALCNTGNTQVMVSHIGFALRAPDSGGQQEISTATDQPALPFTLNPGEIRSLLAWTN